jgi:CRISPR-associated endonuclease Cas1
MEVLAPMAASGTLPQATLSRKSAIGRSGVLALFGYGIKVRMQCGHLEIEDGIGPERRRVRLARVGHGLKRLVIVGSDGFISLAALQWLADQDASFVMLHPDGTVLTTTGPVRPSESKLRRAQALALSSGSAIRISRELIARKLSGQEQVARHKLLDTLTADSIARFREELTKADTTSSIRLIESQAARVYWSAWSPLRVDFPKSDLPRIPSHWSYFGARVSPLTGSPRLAANPPNAILNYLYSILESEARLAAATLGLDPGLGVLHVDTSARDSLACDLMEPARSHVDAYLLDWITRQPLRRDWFCEQGDGNCRLTQSFAVRLAETAIIWRRAVAPIAEWVARQFWSTTQRRKDSFRAPTHLTQAHRREAKGVSREREIRVPQRVENLCPGCGARIGDASKTCVRCAVPNSTKNMLTAARIGRLTANGPEAQAKRAAKAQKNALAQHAWRPSDQPAWLTPELFAQKIQPLLANVSMSDIRKALGVSNWYASKIRKGYRPHPRHWGMLAELVGASSHT